MENRRVNRPVRDCGALKVPDQTFKENLSKKCKKEAFVVHGFGWSVKAPSFCSQSVDPRNIIKWQPC
jgi:hypothetical protein